MVATFDRPIISTAMFPSAVRAFREQLEQADIVISGGGLIPSLPAIYAARHVVFRWLKRMGKPLVLSGQSLYRFEDRPAPYLLADRIVLRDDIFSRHHALAAGMQQSQMVDGVDPAFCLSPAKKVDIDRALANIGVEPDDRFLAVSLRSGQLALDAVAHAARSALKAKMIDYLLLFGMQRYWRERDEDTLRRFAEIAQDVPMRLVPVWSAAVLKGVLPCREWSSS
jgi:hypothetical protein